MSLIRTIIPERIRKKILDVEAVSIAHVRFVRLTIFLRFLGAKYFTLSNKSFEFNKERLQYFIALHNTTFTNERAVEIPIVLDYMKQYGRGEVLEIGNVLSHYMKVKHDVLDKYEQGKGVINLDIIDFKPEKNTI